MPKDNVVTVVIADDHLAMRAGLQLLLSEDPGIRCVGEAISGEEIIPLIETTRPDVLLLDLSMPQLKDTPAFVRRLRADYPAVEILVITSHDDVGLISALLKAGVRGFMNKAEMDSMDDSLVQAVRQVARGEPYLTRQALRGTLYGLQQGASTETRVLAALSEREVEVLRLVSEGLTNDEIGRALSISPLTARNHLSRIYDKLNVRGRAEAVRYAVESGLFNRKGGDTL